MTLFYFFQAVLSFPLSRGSTVSALLHIEPCARFSNGCREVVHEVKMYNIRTVQ